MAIAIVLILLVIGSIAFHFLSPWWFTEIASNWGTIDDTVLITFWVTGVVFVAVNLFLAWVVVKYRHRAGHTAEYDPEQPRLEFWLTVITAVGVALMLAPGLFVWNQVVQVPEDASEFEVVGQQWHWSYRFPGEDGQFGKTTPHLMSPQNPFGMDPDDPAGQDDVLVADPEVHLPIDEPVKALLRSKDVLHNFTVPQFRTKMDLVPGMVTYLWFTPTREGSFEVMCEELCGISHHAMRGSVVVESREAFETWLAGYPTWGETSGRAVADADRGAAQYAVCAACHGAQGEGNEQLNAPKLAGQEEWYLVRQLESYKNGRRGTHPDDAFGQQMVPMVATLADDQAVRDVAAYIASFPVSIAPHTVTGDVERGEDLYSTCASCHGSEGQGIWSLNAPRLADMDDWYMTRQLRNFRAGIRGGSPDDRYAEQMAAMARILKDDAAINDVVAYINSL